jgi:peptidoglycan/xylan/chitin deacetylase (PgdA/CDA1 family)
VRGWWRWFAIVLLVAVAGFAGYETIESPANQLFGKTVVSGPDDQKIVALTYDDGPNPPYTDEILAVLRKENVHATFFVVGRAVAAYPKTARQEVADGNAIGNHTWAHDHLIVLTPHELRISLQRTDEAIFSATGVRTHIMRPPYGGRDWLVLDETRKLGYTPVMWSVPLARDWENPPAQTIASRILDNVHDGSIIVLHDGNRGLLCKREKLSPRVCDRSQEIAATSIIIETLKQRGYKFVTVPQLIALRGTTHTTAHVSE